LKPRRRPKKLLGVSSRRAKRREVGEKNFCPPAFRAESVAGVGSGSFLRQQGDKARKIR